jgi:hypothetical protein
MNKTLIIRLSGIALIIASAGVMADAFDLADPELAIGTMFFALLAGSIGIALFLLQSAGTLAAALGLLGVALILGAQPFYPRDTFAWMFALGQLSLGLALLQDGPLTRLVSIFWIAPGVVSLPPLVRATGGGDFVTFGLALLGLGCTLWTQARDAKLG